MKYIIIGLGNYGGVLAEELTALGHEVIGVDSEERNADRLKDKIATSFVIDATDEDALSVLPLRKVDVVIVAIGENFGASVRVVSLLKKNKVPHIYARALDDVHRTVLEAFSIDRILTPEQDAARMLVQFLELNVDVEPFRIDDNYYVFKFNVPAHLVGYGLNELNLEKEFGLKIISLIRGKKALNCMGISIIERNVANEFPENYVVQPDDSLVCYGLYDKFLEFWKSLR
jgi:trk system potassium uptake protein TrkA